MVAAIQRSVVHNNKSNISLQPQKSLLNCNTHTINRTTKKHRGSSSTKAIINSAGIALAIFGVLITTTMGLLSFIRPNPSSSITSVNNRAAAAASVGKMTHDSPLEVVVTAALWAFFAGDALASPTHWFYGGFPQVQRYYGPSGITG